MSGTEPETFQWFVSIGNLLTIIISGAAVIGAVYTLIRYLRQNVTKGITDMKQDLTKDLVGMRGEIKKDMGFISEKLHDQAEATTYNIEHNAKRIDEIKALISMVEHRIEDTKNDTNQRIDIRMQEITRLSNKLDDLRDEQNRLNVEIARKIAVEADDAVRHRVEDRAARQSERYVDKMKAANIRDSANVEIDRAMETIRRRLGQSEEARKTAHIDAKSTRIKEQTEDRDERDAEREDYKEEDRLTRIDERGADRVDYKEEDRLTRVDEMKGERDIRHTDEQRRERYEGDQGKVARTKLEEKEDPHSTHEEKKDAEEKEDQQLEEQEELAKQERIRKRRRREGGGGGEER